MQLQHAFSVLLLTTLSVACSINVFKPLDKFEVAPYARTMDSPSVFGERITIVLDPMIQQLQLTHMENGSFSEKFKFVDYRKSIEASVQNMLNGNFEEIIFKEEAPTEGLALQIHRIKPKVREGELIAEYLYSLEFLFDYDMSLIQDGKIISNAAELNAHPVKVSTRVHSNWSTAAQSSLKLVLEDCYNQLFLNGMAKQ